MLKQKNKQKEIREEERGITLIALVVTIIVLIILAGVSINMLVGENGIITKVQEAKRETEEAEEKEKTELEDVDDIINSFNPNSLAAYVKTGDYVSYVPDTANIDELLNELSIYSGNTDNTKNVTSTLAQETSLKWRVLDIENGKVRLISETPTTSKIALQGAKGYNNAVYLLDKACNILYNKNGYTKKVQNLKIEDIEKYITYDYTQQENPNVDTGKYGGTKEITNSNYIYYPNLFLKEKTSYIDGIIGTELNLSEQKKPIDETFTQAKTNIIVKQTYWKKLMQETDFSNSIYYNLFIHDGNDYYPIYWLSSRSTACGSSKAYFAIRIIYAGQVYGEDLYMSDGEITQKDWRLRPVVTLNSDVVVKSGNGTVSFPYIIGL